MEEIKNAMVEVNTETQEVNTEREGVSEERVVKLTKPYVFEGKEYEEIDLSGLEKLTIRDAIDTQLELFGVEVAASVLCVRPPQHLPELWQRRRPDCLSNFSS